MKDRLENVYAVDIEPTKGSLERLENRILNFESRTQTVIDSLKVDIKVKIDEMEDFDKRVKQVLESGNGGPFDQLTRIVSEISMLEQLHRQLEDRVRVMDAEI